MNSRKNETIGFSKGTNNNKGNGNILLEKLRNQEAMNEEMPLKQGELDMETEKRELQELGIDTRNSEVLGASYFTLRSLGVEPLAAYKIVERDVERIKSTLFSPPPRAGKVNSKTAEAKSFYAPEEVDRLTDEDLKDPKVLENVMKSMTKWKM